MKTIAFILSGLLFNTTLIAQIGDENDKEKHTAKSISAAEEALRAAYREITLSTKEMEEKLNAARQKLQEIQNDSQRIEMQETVEKIKLSLEALEKTKRTLDKASEKIEMSSDAASRESGTDTDTLKLRLGDKKVMIIGGNKEKHDKQGKKADKKEKDGKDENKYWAGIELGIAGYATASNSLAPPRFFEFLELDYSRSVNFSFNFLEKDVKLYREYIKLVSGFGLTVNSYAFKNNIALAPDVNIIAALTDSSVHYDKNKLKATWINVPVLVGLSSHQDSKKAFHLSGGLVLGYKIGSKTKRKYDVNGKEYKSKVKSAYNMLPYHYSARVGLGYSNFNLYASYTLSNLFEKGEGPEMHPFTLGVSLIGL